MSSVSSLKIKINSWRFRLRYSSWPSLRINPRKFIGVLLFVVLMLFTFYFFTRALQRHYSFSSFGDLAAHDQVQWNTVQGDWFKWSVTYSYHDMWKELGKPDWQNANLTVTKWGLNAFGVHMFPALFLLVTPFYAILPKIEVLLFLQILYLVLGSMAVFLLTREILKTRFLAFAFALSYLLHPALAGIALVDFHPIAFSVPLVLFAFYFFKKQMWPLYFIFVVLALLTEEAVSLYTVFFGIYIFFFEKNKKIGLLTGIIGLLWFFCTFYFLIPKLNAKGNYFFFGYYSNLGQTQSAIFKTLLFNPLFILQTIFTKAKLIYILKLFLPVLFIPIFSPAILLTSAGLAQNLLTSNHAQTMMWGQYNSGLLPFIYLSAILGVKNIMSLCAKWRISHGAVILGVLLLISGLACNVIYSFFPVHKQVHFVSDDDRLSQQALAKIPHDASVSAFEQALGHVAQREKLFIFPIHYTHTDYVITDNHKEWYLTQEQHDYFLGKLKETHDLQAKTWRLTVFKKKETKK